NGQILHESEDPNLIIVTQRGACKRMTVQVFERSSRARRGVMMLRELKSKPHRIQGFFILEKDEKLHFITSDEEKVELISYGLAISNRQSSGSCVMDTDNEGNIQGIVTGS